MSEHSSMVARQKFWNDPEFFVSNYYYAKLKRRAKSRGIEFLLEKDELVDLMYDNSDGDKVFCAISGIKLDFYIGAKDIASVDRIDSSKPYVLGNVQVVSARVNVMKSDFDSKEFVDLCKMVVKNAKRLTSTSF